MIKVSCPICERTMDGQSRREWPDWPFCSNRCKIIDLGRWLSGSYRIERPVEEEDIDDNTDQHSNPVVPSAVPDRDEA